MPLMPGIMMSSRTMEGLRGPIYGQSRRTIVDPSAAEPLRGQEIGQERAYLGFVVDYQYL